MLAQSQHASCPSLQEEDMEGNAGNDESVFESLWGPRREAALAQYVFQDAEYPRSKYLNLGTEKKPERYLYGQWAGEAYEGVRFSEQLLSKRLPGNDGSTRFSVRMLPASGTQVLV